MLQPRLELPTNRALVLGFYGDGSTGKSTITKAVARLISPTCHFESAGALNEKHRLSMLPVLDPTAHRAFLMEHPEHDKAIERFMKQSMREHKQIACEGRCVGWVIDELRAEGMQRPALTFELYCDLDESARRRLKQGGRVDAQGDLEQIRQNLRRRNLEDRARLEFNYPDWYAKPHVPTLRFDTTRLSQQTIFNTVVTLVCSHLGLAAPDDQMLIEALLKP